MRSFAPLAMLALAFLLAGCDSGSTNSDLDDTFGCSVGSISLGQTVSGTISRSDCEYLDEDGTYADYYAFTLTESTIVVIDQTSDAMDSFLSLYDDRANELVYDDDGGSGLDSRITRSLSAGTYVIAANTNDFAEGPYMLTLDEAVGG